jgi:signal transduction histidine kinase
MDTAAPDPVLSGQGVTSSLGNSAGRGTPSRGASLMARLVRPAAPPLWFGLVVATSFIVLETLAVYPLKRFAANGTLAVYLVGIVVVAIVWGFWLAAITSVISALTYDYFHTPPLYEITLFSLHKADDWVALTAFLVFALMASTLTDLARWRAAEANRCRREAEASRDRLTVLATQQEALRRVATLVAREVSPSEVFSAVAKEMARCLDAQDAFILRYEGDDAAIVVASHGEPGFDHLRVGERLTLEGDNVAATVLRTGRPARMDSYENAAGSLAARIRELGLRSRVGSPIVVGKGLWGTAVVGSSRPEPLPPDTEERTAEWAELAATAIANAATRAELIDSRARIVVAADDARRRLERDLHDGAQQRLIALGLKLRAAQAAVAPDQIDLETELSEAISDLLEVSHELQEISRGIHPAILSQGGLAPALDTLAIRSPVPVDLDLAINQPLSDLVEVAAYYVVAEALTNAAKHAHASQVTVSAKTHDHTLILSIDDDGIGGADSGKQGSGLIGLKDRVEVLGGQMHISSPPGSGTFLNVTIPLHSEKTLDSAAPESSSSGDNVGGAGIRG